MGMDEDFSPEVLAELQRRHKALDLTPTYPLDEVLRELGIDVSERDTVSS